MAKNETVMDWLEKNHPEILAIYREYLLQKKRERARNYQRDLQRRANGEDV